MKQPPPAASRQALPAGEAASQLVRAAHRRIAAEGLDVSVRDIAADAGAHASAVNYHFGDKDRLLDAVFEEAVDAWVEACESALALWRKAGASVPHLPAFLAGLIAEAAERSLARSLVLRECVLESTRLQSPRRAAARYVETALAFFGEIVAACGGDRASANALAAFAESEQALHLATRRSPTALPVLIENCRHIAALLLGNEIPIETAWRESLAVPLGVFQTADSGVKPEIASAVAALISEAGTRGVTHRGVAARAGVTLAAVVHHFPTVRSLLNAGYLATYTDVLSATPAHVRVFSSVQDFVRPVLTVCAQRQGAIARMTRGTDALLLSSARDESLAHLALDLRLSGGQTSCWALNRITTLARPVRPPTAYLYELYMAGLMRHALALGAESAFPGRLEEIAGITGRLVK